MRVYGWMDGLKDVGMDAVGDCGSVVHGLEGRGLTSFTCRLHVNVSLGKILAVGCKCRNV